MSRHNRRRTRGGNKASPRTQCNAFELRYSTVPSVTPDARHPQRYDLSARYCHTRHHAWQTRGRKQKEESEKLQEERKRIFGGDGDDGEDDGLCWMMMDYFVRLDYLEGWLL